MANYPTLGPLTVVPVADVLNLVSKINSKRGDNRLSATGFHKSAGRVILCDNGDGTFTKLFAVANHSNSAWQIPDGSAQKVPVSILNEGGGAAWTLVTATYAASVFTVATGNASNATQAVTLKAGNYRLIITANTHDALKVLRLKATAATDGVVVNQLLSNAVLSTDDSLKTSFTIDFTLTTASQVVTFAHTIEAIATPNTPTTGVAFITYGLHAGNN